MRGVVVILICVILLTMICEIASAGIRGRRYKEDAGRTSSVLVKDAK